MGDSVVFIITIDPAEEVKIDTSIIPPGGKVGVPYSFQLAAHVTGNPGPYVWLATGLPPGLTCSESGLLNGTPTEAGSYSANIAVVPPSSGVKLLPSFVAQAKAKIGTPQGQAFKAQLDASLPKLLGFETAAYEGSHLAYIADYALGYQCLKDSDPLISSNYADKAIALMKSALNDYQRGLWVEMQYLARGDGSATTFTIPNADFNPATLKVFFSTVTPKAVVRGSTDTDAVDYYQRFLKVSNTPDGPANYIEGTDWRYSGDQPNNVIQWLSGGNQPLVGETYYVSETSASGIGPVGGYTVNGSTITFATPPDANQVVWVAYLYGSHSDDGSTLAYQQTSAGDGGFNSILIDTTYTSRYLGKYMALGLDWLDGYVGFSAALKAEAIDLLKQWFNWLSANGYHYSSPASNYGAGSYCSQVFTALALQGRDADAPAMLSQMLTYRTANFLPLLQNQTASLVGGFWAEGWNYGPLATQNILHASLALEDAGQLTATAERAWASDVVKHLVEASPTPSTMYNGGDWYAYPAPFPGKDMFVTLSAVADDTAPKSYANEILQNYAGTLSANTWDLFFRDPSATTANWTNDLPLQWFAGGTGLLTARSDWGSNPTWIAFQLGNLLGADHQTYTPGQLQIQRGCDDLLVNATSIGEEQTPPKKSFYGNTLVVDDNGEGVQNYRYSMGVWYGTPGVTVTAYEASDSHVYMAGDYHAAYFNAYTGTGPASELTRDVLFVRPNYVVVYDRATTIQDAYPKQQRWHFLAAPTVNGNAFVTTAGQSKLFGVTFSTVPLTTTVAAVQVNNATVQQLITQNASPIAKLRYVTAFQITDSSVQAMDATAHVVTTDGQLEGVALGSAVVMFVSTPPWSGPSSYTVTSPASQTATHYVVGLPSNRACTLTGANEASASVSAAGVLTFTTTGTGSPQTVTIS